MLVADMMHSCSNDRVAWAAVASIGGDFAELVAIRAEAEGLSAGDFVSSIVRGFKGRADEAVFAELQGRISGADQPLLAGLRFIVEQALSPYEATRTNDATPSAIRPRGGLCCAPRNVNPCFA